MRVVFQSSACYTFEMILPSTSSAPSSTSVFSGKWASTLYTLRAGMVPLHGLREIFVGRTLEIQAVALDIERLSTQGACFRFVVGPYGAGKTFFMSLTRDLAYLKNIVTMQADMNPDRRLQGGKGQARSLYTELVSKMSVRAKRDGGALNLLLDQFAAKSIAVCQDQSLDLEVYLPQSLAAMQSMVNGFDFCEILVAYCKAYRSKDEPRKAACRKWLRGEYSTKTQAKEDLGVRSIIEDASVYDHLKLMAVWIQHIGYCGLLVQIDELVNIFKLANPQAREKNYEQILRMFNDSMQQPTPGFGIMLGGTPEFVYHPQRGMYSYEALKSRLTKNAFAKDGRVDFSGPVLELSPLTESEFYALLVNIRRLAADGQDETMLVPDEGLLEFITYCKHKVGAQYFRTPRLSIVTFLHWLSMIKQYPDVGWRATLGDVAKGASNPVPSTNPSNAVVNTVVLDEEELDDFVLDEKS
jgi:hypothetical protein